MLSHIDRMLMRAMRGVGLETFDAQFFKRDDSGVSVDCLVTRDTLELQNEYGVSVLESGARIGYLLDEIDNVRIGDWFEFGGVRYIVENREPSQDSSLRFVHCREEILSG